MLGFMNQSNTETNIKMPRLQFFSPPKLDKILQFNCLRWRRLPFQKCHDPRPLSSAYHVMHPPPESRTFDSRQDSRCHVQPGETIQW